MSMTDMDMALAARQEVQMLRPADEKDFLRWLDCADTEEKLFSRLTYWFTFRGLAADQNERYHLVQERAKELKLWNGLELKLRRWQDNVAAEYKRLGKEEFAARIGEDYADYLNQLDEDGNAPSAREKAGTPPRTEAAGGQAVRAFSAQELLTMELPPLRYVVEGLLPMGLGVLVAKPKLGKSWMVLDLCLSVAGGTPFLGFATRQHSSLYLALEDGQSRMQTRLQKVLENRPVPENMHVMFKASRLDEEASFVLTGRDIEQCERVVRFDKTRCRWVMEGTAAELAAQRRVEQYEADPVVRTLRVLLQQGDGTWSGYSKNLLELGQRYAHTELDPSPQALAKHITALEPMLWERDAVKHWIQPNGNSGKKHCFRMSRIDNTMQPSHSEQLSLRHNFC